MLKKLSTKSGDAQFRPTEWLIGVQQERQHGEVRRLWHKFRFQKTRDWLRANHDLVKSYAIFVLFAVVAFSAVTTLWGRENFLSPLNVFIADCSAACLNIIGMDAQSSGTAVSASFGSVDIKEGCNGVYATILFLAGVIAFPTSWKKKLIGIVFGTIAIYIINLIRVMTLLYLSINYPKLFHEAHQYIWQFVIIIAGGLMWLIWYDKVVTRKTSSEAV